MPSRLIESSAILGLLLLIMVQKQFSFSDPLLLTVGAFIAAAYKIIPGIVKLINISGQMKAYEFLFEKEEKWKAETLLSAASSIHSVEIRNLDFAFNANTVLQEINLQAGKGCFLGIQGRSGIGKTTLFNLILGFYAPDGGNILVNGIPRSPAQLKAFWPSIAYVKQHNFLIHDTIEKNICFEEEVSDPERLEKAIVISGLNELTAGFPEGIKKIIYENGRDISGGQQQRIGIARALYKNADLVLLDEPFSELDEASEYRLLEYFRELAETGRIIIMISHNSRALEYCHKIISLDEEGTENTGNTYAGISGIGG
jgi:ABC-type bacteriocin/lantibiotic exporter with double-glycine peptidase domain